MFREKVLVGHSDAVLTVAVSVNNKSQVISGSKDCNLIVWDISTGEEIHTLAGHLGAVTCVKVSADGKEINVSLFSQFNSTSFVSKAQRLCQVVTTKQSSFGKHYVDWR